MLPLLVIPAVCCFTVAWKCTKHCFCLPALLSTDKVAMEALGFSFGIRLLQTISVSLVMYNAVYYGTRPEITFSDPTPPHWTLKMSLFYTITGRIISQIVLCKMIYFNVSNRSKLFATFAASIILAELVYSILSIYRIDTTLGKYITTIILGQVLSLPFEFFLVSVVCLYTTFARRERKAQLHALLRILLCGSLLPVILRASYAIYAPLSLLVSQDLLRRITQTHILTEFYVLGSLYPLIRLPTISIFAVSARDDEHSHTVSAEVSLKAETEKV